MVRPRGFEWQFPVQSGTKAASTGERSLRAQSGTRGEDDPGRSSPATEVR
jgi:hypothetical protein